MILFGCIMQSPFDDLVKSIVSKSAIFGRVICIHSCRYTSVHGQCTVYDMFFVKL